MIKGEVGTVGCGSNSVVAPLLNTKTSTSDVLVVGVSPADLSRRIASIARLCSDEKSSNLPIHVLNWKAASVLKNMIFRYFDISCASELEVGCSEVFFLLIPFVIIHLVKAFYKVTNAAFFYLIRQILIDKNLALIFILTFILSRG